MKKISKNSILIITVFSVFIAFSCEKAITNSSADIKLEFRKIQKTKSTKLSSDIVEFRYDEMNQVLYLTHSNAAFNSCSKVSANFKVIGNEIVISETESKNNCHALDLFEVHFAIQNLEKGNYSVVINEPYVHLSLEKLRFKIDLNKKTSGYFLVKRNFYPWGN